MSRRPAHGKFRSQCSANPAFLTGMPPSNSGRGSPGTRLQEAQSRAIRRRRRLRVPIQRGFAARAGRISPHARHQRYRHGRNQTHSAWAAAISSAVATWGVAVGAGGVPSCAALTGPASRQIDATKTSKAESKDDSGNREQEETPDSWKASANFLAAS